MPRFVELALLSPAKLYFSDVKTSDELYPHAMIEIAVSDIAPGDDLDIVIDVPVVTLFVENVYLSR